jgi:hypothetical protein
MKTIRPTSAGPGGDAFEMSADHDRNVLQRIDLGPQDVDALLLQYDGHDDLFAIENVEQLLAIEPYARSWASLLRSLSNAQRNPLSARSAFCSKRRISSTASWREQ